MLESFYRCSGIKVYLSHRWQKTPLIYILCKLVFPLTSGLFSWNFDIYNFSRFSVSNIFTFAMKWLEWWKDPRYSWDFSGFFSTSAKNINGYSDKVCLRYKICLLYTFVNIRSVSRSFFRFSLYYFVTASLLG